MADEKVGVIEYSKLEALDSVTKENMNEELKVSVILAIIYYVFLLTVTILNWTSPDLMKTILWGGMSLTWFATAIVALVMATLIAWLHVLHYQSRLAKTTKS